MAKKLNEAQQLALVAFLGQLGFTIAVPDVEDEDDDDAPPAKKSAPKAARKQVEEEDEDDEEPAPKKSAPKSTGSVPDEDEIDALPRSKLIPIAKGLGIDTTGLTVEKLREAIKSAGSKPAKGKKAAEPEEDEDDEPTPKKKGAPAKAKKAVEEDEDDEEEEKPKKAPAKASKKPPADEEDDEEEEAPKKAAPKGKAKVTKPAEEKAKLPKARLRVLQDNLVSVIESEWDELEAAVTDLGCGGDCHNCPKPEESSVEKQVVACTKSVYEALEKKAPKEVRAVLAEYEADEEDED